MSYLGPSLRRVARSRSAGRRVLAALAVSLLVNLFLVTRLDLSWLSAAAGPARSVSLSPLSSRDWESNRAVGARRLAPPPQARPAPPPPQALPPSQVPGQVVKVAPPIDPAKDPPKDAKYLSEYNSSVEKETRSRKVGDGNPPARSPRPPVAPPVGQPHQTGAQAVAKAEPPRPERKAEERLALGRDPNLEPRLPQEQRDREAPRAPAPGEAGPQGLPGGDASQRKLDLRPSATMFEPPQHAGSGGSPDYLPGVEEGEGTFLNTREWKYAGFFNRIMGEVRPNWERELIGAADARDPTRQRFFYKDRETVIRIRLEANGHLADIRVLQSSGVPFLDEAVVKAWKQTEPFVNVPRGLVNERGEVAFNAGFIALGVNGSPVGLFLGPSR